MTDEFQNLFEDNFLDDIETTSTEKLKEGERRIVSILFADISGFTKLSEKMDHEEVRDIIDNLFKVFTSSVEKHGGYVDKYAGDEIMALFGAKVASEVDTHRAISCGMDMLDKLDKFNHYIINNPKYNINSDNKLSMRVGINTGMVTTGSIGKGREGDFTVYGDVVNLASRMESNAPVNRIMVPESTMKQAQRNFSFSDHGMIEVKGFENEIRVYLVESVHEAADAKANVPYVGDRKNLDLLLDAYSSLSSSLDEHHRSDLCAIGIKGEAGIGKSRLVSEFIRSSSQGIKTNNIIRVAADSVSSSPYQTFITIIKRSLLIERSDSQDVVLKKFNQGFNDISDVLDESLANQFIKFKPRIAYLLGLKITEQTSDASGKDLRDEIQLSIRIFVQAICARSNLSNVPFIIIIEDLQWMDLASLDVLNKIIDMESIGISKNDQKNQALFFVFNYRDSYDVPDFIGRIDSFSQLRVNPFNADQCREMIRDTMNEDIIPDEVVKVLMEQSGGNPFFIEEWLKGLGDGLKWSTDDISSWISSIPESMHSLILSGVDTLDESSKTVLKCASVIGKRFYLDMIKQLEGKVDNLADVSSALKVLTKENFIISENGNVKSYIFRNALTRDIAYESILKSNKKLLHGILADIMETDYNDKEEELVDQLANHYEQSDNIEKAKIYLVKAAKKSQNLYNINHANDLYKRAVDIYISSDENLKSILDGKIKNVSHDKATDFVNILHEYTNVLMSLGEMDKCIQILTAIKAVIDNDLQDKKLCCSLSGSIGKMYFLMGSYDEAEQNFIEQLSLSKELDTPDDKFNALLYIAKINRIHGNYKKAIEHLDALKNKFHSRDFLLEQVLSELGVVHKNEGDFDTALECYQRQEKICIKNNYKTSLLAALGNMGIVYRNQKEYEKALGMFDRVLILNQDIGDRVIISKTHGNKGIILKNMKNYKDSLNEYKMQLKICEYSRDKQGIERAKSNSGNVYKKLGEYDTAISCFKEALQIAIEIGNKTEEGISLGNIGEVLMETGDVKGSREHLEGALTIFRENGDRKLEKIILDDIKKLENKE